MSYDSNTKEIIELQQKLCNIISYVLYLYEKKIISERTKDEILKICNGETKKSCKKKMKVS